MAEFSLNKAVSFVLPNGLKYILHQDPSEPVVCMQAVVKTGSANERLTQEGYSHFIEHLSFKSSKHFGFNQISNTISNLGGSLNAYTDFDSTCYYLLLPSEHLDEGMRVLAELMMHARFSAEDVETEKEIILSEIEQYNDDPETDFLEYIQTHYYRRSPLRKPIAGNPQSVKSATYARLKDFYRRRYHPGNSFIVVSGDACADQLGQIMNNRFGSWKTPARPWQAPSPYNWLQPEQGRGGFNWQKANENLFALVLPELSELHPSSDALLVAIRQLAIGRASKLYKRLVEDKKLCSAVRVSSLCGVMSGASVVVFVPAKKDAIPAIAKVIREEISALWQNVIAQDEFELICQDIIHGWLFGFEARENIANLLVAEELLGDYQHLYDYGDRIKSLSPQDVQKAVHQFWQPQLLSMFQRGNSAMSLPRDLIPSHPGYLMDFKKGKAISHTAVSFSCNKKAFNSDSIEQVDARHWQGKLDNGIRFVYKQLAKNPVTGFSLSSPACQLWEDDTHRGHNYFLSTALLYQSEKFSHAEIMELSRRLGLNIRVTHNVDTTTYRGKCFQNDLPQALALLAELLTNPRLDKSYLQTLKAAASDAQRRESEHPPSFAYLLWLKTAFGKSSPIQRATGIQKDIQSIRIADLEDWHASYYHSQNFNLAICSELEPEKAFDLIESCLGSIPKSINATPPDIQPLEPQPAQSKISSGANGQTLIHTGAPGPRSSDRVATTASHLLGQIIGGDINSRFFDIIREKHGLAYQTGMEFVTLEQAGFWVAYAFCNHSQKKLCKQLMQDIILDVSQNGVTAQELSKAQNYLIGMHRFDCESVSYQASSLANLIALDYPLSHLLNRVQRIASIELDTINAVAAIWLKDPQYWSHILQ